MKELVGRLTALDPVASESLKVITYFDALASGGVGLDGLLRAAAALAGTAAGAERRGRTHRFEPSGRRAEGARPVVRRPERTGAGFSVWLERDGSLHANDEMVVERLALAVELLEARRAPAGGLDVALDPSLPLEHRTAALARLRLDAGLRIRMLATPVADPAPGSPSCVVPTRYGLLRATLDATGSAWPVGRGGLGPWASADHAPESWDGAVTAFQLGDATDPVIDADQLGAVLLLARAHDPDHPHEDVVTLGRLSAHESSILRALVAADSIRAAAALVGMHHSSVQARHESLTLQLGYDPRTPTGRMRYTAAEILRRLVRAEPPA